MLPLNDGIWGATLSTGPVMLGDMIKAEDPALILRSCRTDGALLQPDRPATPIDANVLARVSPGAPGPRGVVLSTFTDVSRHRWIYILAVGTATYQLRPEEAPLPPSSRGYVAVETKAAHAARSFDGGNALPLQSRDELDFQLWTVAPRLSNGWALLGEAGTKWVGVSRRRFASIEAAPDGGLVVQCHGVTGERIELLAVPPDVSQALAVWHTFVTNGTEFVLITR